MTRFLRRHALTLASIVVAAASLFVAILSLRYSVGAQKEDAFYKELSIKPALQIAADSVHFEIRFDNVGLGPAQIRRVVFSDNKTCLDTDSVHDWNAAHAFFDEFSNAVSTYMMRDLPAAIDKKPAPIPNPFVPVLSPGVIIKPGDKHTVISFGVDEINAYFKFLAKFDVDAPKRTEQLFIHRGLTVPMYIQYCSLSGRYCQQTTGNDVLDCTRKKSPDASPGSTK